LGGRPPRRSTSPVAIVITQEQLRAGLTQAGLPAGAVNIVVGIQQSFCARQPPTRTPLTLKVRPAIVTA